MIRNVYNTTLKIVLSSFLLFSAVNESSAQLPSASHTVHLNSGDIPMAPNAARWIDSTRAIASAEPVLALVHFTKLPTDGEKQALKTQGITLLDYLPDNTFAAHVQFPVENAAITASIYGITNVKPEWKASKYIWNKVSNGKGRVEVLVTFYPTVNAAAVKQLVTTLGGQVNPSSLEQYSAYKIVLDANQLHAIASWYGVQNIAPATQMVPFDLQSAPATKVNIGAGNTAFGGYGLNGAGVTVGIGDNSSGIYHADIKDRITNFNPVGRGTHGAHVNGIVGGTGNIDPLALGAAPHVNLIDYFFDQILSSTGAMYHDFNMTVTNNSYGVILGDCDYSGTYDGYARFLDTLSIQYPEVLHVFASGNDGDMNCAPWPMGYGTVGGGYQPAKNNVVVGSMTDYQDQAFDESRGPTKDGRLKPDIVAVGLGAYSTIGEDAYEWAAGTSMASPQAAGGVALLTQRYKQLHTVNPRADLLKAVLLNGAMDLGNPGPDFAYGFGAMDVGRSLKMLDSTWYHAGALNTGDSMILGIVVPPNTAQLKVLLTWQDVPANTASAKQLVNDLDLSVKTPGSVVHLPLVPDENPANITNNAIEKKDHINNTEQVTINNPAPGSYQIFVGGYNVPIAGQKYVVAYDMLPKGVQLTYPVGGEAISNIDTANKYDSVRIFWNAVSDGNTFTVQLSADNGASWSTLANAVPADRRNIAWRPFGYNSEKCLVRISRNGTSDVATSGNFVISNIPTLQLDTAQCPGYVNVHWSPAPNATAYQMLAKRGPNMVVDAVVTGTSYTFKNMSLKGRSYVAIRPLINGVEGYRSVALTVYANTGNCTNPVSTGDLMIEKVNGPVSGRKFTRTELTNSETLKLLVRNLYSTACNSYAINYNINGTGWQTYTAGPLIPANGTATVSIPGIDLSATGTYNFAIAIRNQVVADPQHANDTIYYTVKQISNDTVSLPFTDGFETMDSISVTGKDSVGIAPNGRWDFQTYDTAGRLRSFVNRDVLITGRRSISLDENQNVKNGSSNSLIGTFNLSNYDTANTELRLDFDYVLHGTPKTADGNNLLARAKDALPWTSLFTYNLNAYPGFLNHAQSISLTDAVRYYGNNFTTSFQLAFGQNDTSLICGPNYGNGMTIDNVKIYTVANDAALTQVVSPLQTSCGLSGLQPLTVTVHNGVNYTLHSVQLHYQMDGGTVYNGLLDSLTAKQTINYTFAQQITINTGVTHKLDVWLTVAGDTYTPNDSLLNYKFRNNPIITSYPYLENFEAGNGGFYTEGVNNSWQYGTPASTRVTRAASGIKAWKTNLTGRYNNLELSYLYTPCFDISTLTSPMLSFSAAMDVENCGNTMCDKAYVEYSTDGRNWTKLGHANQGTNWYDSTFNVWNTNSFTRWHVASIPIPPGNVTMSFRFVLSTDPGATFEGLTIDDVHIFDRAAGIYPATGVTTLTQNASGNTWLNYLQTNQLVASLQPNNQPINNAAITLYRQDNLGNPAATQYTFPRSYSFKAENAADSAYIRLYLTDNDLSKVLSDTSCASCTPVQDAYRLGITQYRNSNSPATENATLADDTGGAYTYIPYNKVKWVPYDNGYYAEIKTLPVSEYWFNNGGPTGTVAAGVDYLNFIATKNGNDVRLTWRSIIDTEVNNYLLERSTDGIHFAAVLDTVAAHSNPGAYTHTEYAEFPASTVVYYRLKWTMTWNTDTLVSPIRKVLATDDDNSLVNLTAQMAGKGKVLAEWTSYIDAIADHYVLEREIGDRGYTTINNSIAAHHYGQKYQVTDAPTNVSQGTLLHYRLTATLDDGTTLTLPIRTVEWAEPNTVASIYPNPCFDGNININWYADPGTELQINLTDITGKSFYNTTAQAGHWSNSTTIATPDKPKGVYILRTNIAGKKASQKVVFE